MFEEGSFGEETILLRASFGLCQVSVLQCLRKVFTALFLHFVMLQPLLATMTPVCWMACRRTWGWQRVWISLKDILLLHYILFCFIYSLSCLNPYVLNIFLFPLFMFSTWSCIWCMTCYRNKVWLPQRCLHQSIRWQQIPTLSPHWCGTLRRWIQKHTLTHYIPWFT